MAAAPSPRTVTLTPKRLAGAALAACLTLLLGAGLLSGGAESGRQWQTPLLADEVVSGDDAMPGQVTLSATTAQSEGGALIETPVIATDGERFAYIKSDLSAYTIFLGNLDSDAEPVAIFSSQNRLSNLAWSPVGNALLFARHDAMTPAAVFGDERRAAELFSLNLDNGKLRRLVEDSAPSEPEDAPRVNLTALDPAWIHLLRTRVPPGLPG